MASNKNNTVLFARQPIYTYTQELAGFELLFRNAAGDQSVPTVFDDDSATSRVLINAFTESDIEEVCSHKPAFVNFAAEALHSGIPFPPGKLVVEVLESIEPTDKNIHALKRLRRLGYRIAIDDYTAEDPRYQLLKYADIVKLEYPSYTTRSLASMCARLKYTHPGLQLLAEKVETHRDFEIARTAGCDLFQGYFLARPEIVYGQKMPIDRLNVLHLLSVLNNQASNMEEIVKIIGKDPTLSVRLLRLVNSALYYYHRTVTSLRMAVMILGTTRIHAYANLLVLSRLEGKPLALQRIAATRGFVCQVLCERLPVVPETGFIVGLFSCLDALIDRSLEDLLQSLPLNEEINRALLYHEGMLGTVLAGVIAHEEGRLEDMPWTELCELGIGRATFMSAFEHGVLLANDSFIYRKPDQAEPPSA